MRWQDGAILTLALVRQAVRPAPVEGPATVVGLARQLEGITDFIGRTFGRVPNGPLDYDRIEAMGAALGELNGRVRQLGVGVGAVGEQLLGLYRGLRR